jgi:hypothetical protein
MGIDDGAKLRRRFEVRHQAGRDPRRHGEHDGIVGRELFHPLAEVEARDALLA